MPKENNKIEIHTDEGNLYLKTPCGSKFSFPISDVLLLPISNTSAERLAIYINSEIRRMTFEKYNFRFKNLEIEVEETPGQSAIFIYKEERQ